MKTAQKPFIVKTLRYVADRKCGVTGNALWARAELPRNKDRAIMRRLQRPDLRALISLNLIRCTKRRYYITDLGKMLLAGIDAA